jgi:hypothetical protein
MGLQDFTRHIRTPVSLVHTDTLAVSQVQHARTAASGLIEGRMRKANSVRRAT